MLKLAIVTRPDNASPRVLAETLHEFIKLTGSNSEVLYGTGALRRLARVSEMPLARRLPWIAYKAVHYLADRALFRRLREFDAIVICETCPYAFLRRALHIDRLRTRVPHTPILYYEVYFLENAPTVVERLQREQHRLASQFDWHLAVSDVTEVRQRPRPPWSRIGLFLRSTGLQPAPKQRLLAVVDFEREGHEAYRRDQIRVLEELEIPYVSLERRYTIQEIREIYRQATFYFIQFREAFGLPIAECLASGSYVLMPDPSWAMSWRLDPHPQVHGPGTMADCFIVYRDADDLRRRLTELKATYDLQRTPYEVFEQFRGSYPAFYEGDIQSLTQVLDALARGEIG